MKVSIGIPAYNAAKYLPETIASILTQEGVEWELIVVDDGSTDSTAQIVESYALSDTRIRLVKTSNSGVCSARNVAFAAMRQSSDYILFIDADDALLPNALSTMIYALQGQPEAVAVAGLSCYIDENSVPMPDACEGWCREPHLRLNKMMPSQQPSHFVLSYRSCIASPGSVLICADAARQAGEWDAATSPCEDWDMWLRLSCIGEFIFLDEVVLLYRRHSDNMSSNIAIMSRGVKVVRRKALRNAKNTPALYTQTLRACSIYHQDRAAWSRRDLVKNAHRFQLLALARNVASTLNHGLRRLLFHIALFFRRHSRQN